MLPDIETGPNNWVDIYKATGITRGRSLLVQNKGEGAVLLWEGSTAPGPNSRDGARILNNEWTTMNGAQECWVGKFDGRRGRLFVQEDVS